MTSAWSQLTAICAFSWSLLMSRMITPWNNRVISENASVSSARDFHILVRIFAFLSKATMQNAQTWYSLTFLVKHQRHSCQLNPGKLLHIIPAEWVGISNPVITIMRFEPSWSSWHEVPVSMISSIYYDGYAAPKLPMQYESNLELRVTMLNWFWVNGWFFFILDGSSLRAL